jgi:hypothetical protein
MQVQGDQRRRERRVQVSGSVRLLVDSADGLVTTHGQLVDLSEGGFAVHLSRPMDTHHAGRVNLVVDGKALWLPMVTRWARADSGGWTVGCEFDRPTPDKVQALRAMLQRR